MLGGTIRKSWDRGDFFFGEMFPDESFRALWWMASDDFVWGDDEVDTEVVCRCGEWLIEDLERVNCGEDGGLRSEEIGFLE